MGRGTSGARTMRRMSGESRNSRVQREVVQLILDRKLQPGAPLPTEAELMEDLGISRNSVREALKALQALDIVEIRHGYGTYVGRASLTPSPTASPSAPSPGTRTTRTRWPRSSRCARCWRKA